MENGGLDPMPVEQRLLLESIFNLFCLTIGMPPYVDLIDSYGDAESNDFDPTQMSSQHFAYS